MSAHPLKLSSKGEKLLIVSPLSGASRPRLSSLHGLLGCSCNMYCEQSKKKSGEASRREKLCEIVVHKNAVRVELPRYLPQQRKARSVSTLHLGVGVGHVGLGPLSPVRVSGLRTILSSEAQVESVYS